MLAIVSQCVFISVLFLVQLQIPPGEPPQYGLAKLKGDRVELRVLGQAYDTVQAMNQMPDGKLQSYSTFAVFSAEICWETSLKELQAFSTTGEPINQKDLVSRVQKEAVVLIVHDRKPDPFYLRLLKETAIIIVVPRSKLYPPLPEAPQFKDISSGTDRSDSIKGNSLSRNSAWKDAIARDGFRAIKFQKIGPSLCVNATINGQPVLLEVDTGAFNSHLATDRSPGNSMKWRTTAQSFVSAGSKGNAPTQESQVSQFKLGEFQKANFKIEGVDTNAAQYLQGPRQKLG